MSNGNSQSISYKQGREFERLANSFLEEAGFLLGGNHRSSHLGIEFDQEAWWHLSKKRVLFEHKGSFQGNRPGLMRTDTVKKAVLSGFLNQTYENPDPYCIVTSHIQARDLHRIYGKYDYENCNYPDMDWSKIPSGLAMLHRAIECGAVNAVWVIGDGSDDTLIKYSTLKLKEYMATGEYDFNDYIDHVSGRYHEGDRDDLSHDPAYGNRVSYLLDNLEGYQHE